MLGNVVDKEHRPPRATRERLHRRTLRTAVDDERCGQTVRREIAQAEGRLLRRDVRQHDDIEERRQFRDRVHCPFDGFERIEFGPELVEQCDDLHIDDDGLVVTPPDIAHQTVARQIEIEAARCEEPVEAEHEAQQYLVGIDDQQRMRRSDRYRCGIGVKNRYGVVLPIGAASDRFL